MLINYLKSAWRSVYRNKLFSLINILGLTVGNEIKIGAMAMTVTGVMEDLPHNTHFGFDAIYRQDKTSGIIVRTFSLLTIFIACLGLSGLSIHSINQRRKEIGIRKILGATSIKITRLLAFDFIKWVILANVIALPLGWYMADKWLNSFAYKIDPGVSTFLIAGLFSIFIALSAMAFQTLKAANSNPKDMLRYE